ncbi:hypothetical protein OUZ56_007815 [Daphnia magna]|uniref:Uncharacterized protein n=1 Tax=Daphnia magna TaxID=35525 RepID=A0ABR0ABE7_9CRUS|nr:hypothetical protein OUZ56_007815 [Daphnia magna]
MRGITWTDDSGIIVGGTNNSEHIVAVFGSGCTPCRQGDNSRENKAVRPDEKETNLTAALCRLTTLMPIVHCEKYRRESIQEGPSPWNELYPADILSLVYETADEVLIRV